MAPRKSTLAALLALVVAALAGSLGAKKPAPPPAPTVAGRIGAPSHHETSGLAASHRATDLLWTHDDGGHEPVIHAISTQGAWRGALRLDGVTNNDWEDIASFELDGRAWLLVGDVGDNRANRTVVMLYVVEEPPPEQLAPAHELHTAPAYTIAFTYPDGPRDCESVAVDTTERAVYLLSKRDAVPRLYRLPLQRPSTAKPLSAEFVGLVSHIPEVPAAERLRAGHLKHGALPTAMDFSPDGSAAVVLTYAEPLLFPRRRGMSWAEALAGEPVPLAPHHLPQAEGACFSRDGTQLYVASERSRDLLRYERPASPAR
jgi:hypothetical protein